jgi:hypothetical protein
MCSAILDNTPSAQPVQRKTLEFLLAFWRAWSASTPRAILELFQSAGIYRGRHAILSALLDRYPHIDSGLTFWDHALLKAIRDHGPKLTYVIAYTTYESEVERCGDVWLLSRLDRLARSGSCKALVKIERPNRDRPFIGTVSLTPFGAQVLSGEKSALGAYRVDDWVGGVHLSASNPVWVRTADGLVEWGKT